MKKNESATTLFGILARNAPVGVIFRRGPSHHVQLIKWDLTNDSFEEGQWFKGRVYERRCDLSPNGTLLIYFAATYKEPLRSWTAISKPPWFTALALWPKDDGWNGGGRFTGAYSIHLNHARNQALPHPDFVAGCRKFKIDSYAEFRGEDGSIWHELLARQGWVFVEEAVWSDYEQFKGYAWKAKTPELWRKTHSNKKLVLEMAIEAIGKRNGTWYVSRYRVLDASLEEVLDLGELDRADWDTTGDLVYAKQGVLFRQRFSNSRGTEPKQIADFTRNRLTAIEPVAWAKKL